MTKLTKISAAALFALFLTACDKPADKAAEPAKQETKQTMEAAKPEVAPAPAAATEAPKAEEMKAEMPADAQGVEDFKKLLEWNQSQETMLAQAQAELQQSVASQDKAKVEEAFNAFKGKVDEVLKSLDSLEIKNQEVNAFKAKTKESLMLSSDLITDSVKVMTAPTPEAQAAIQEKAQKLMLLGAELQKAQIELQTKFSK
ncbi:hypothetical protein A1D29_09065 [Pasteurellaceae bacterium Orientalotternb1]|nr:hypothetical protein A1D29_09065 [Pasteurellaceae bacterium Orientalotternb1]